MGVRRPAHSRSCGGSLLVAAGLLARAQPCGALLAPPEEPKASPTAAAVPPPERDLRRDPPRAESLEVVAGDDGRASIRVRFAAPETLPPRLAIDVDGERVVLERRVGADREGVYAGTAPLDARELVARQGRLDELRDRLGRELRFPEFRGRARVRDLPLPRLAVGELLAGAPVALDATWVAPEEVDAARSLLVTDPAVVRDPARTFDPCTGAGTAMGKWTFGYLMQQMAGSADAAALTRDWLGRWETDQTVNGLPVRRRELVRSAVVDPWPRTTPSGPLDLSRAPFRLLAIVNRIDLAENLLYGSGSAGEARFVFGAVGPPPACNPLRFTVIFEYAIERSGCSGLRAWAREWADLAAHPLGSPAYLAALEAITEQLVRAGAAPSRPNGSAIAQVRTNEIALADLAVAGENAWDMREFRLATSGRLEPATVVRTPKGALDRTAELAAFVNANEATIVADAHDVPAESPPGTPFLGGNARAQTATFWTGPSPSAIASPEARFHLSLNTCNACHARETGTAFTHVSPLSPPGSAAGLSGFLLGVDVADPDTGTVRHFADLERRRLRLADLANRSCLFQVFHVPIEMVH
jgi:hypothetical protein